MFNELFHVSFTEKLKFMPKPIDRRLELASTSKIHCKAYGAPPPIVKWVKVSKYTQKYIYFIQRLRRIVRPSL